MPTLAVFGLPVLNSKELILYTKKNSVSVESENSNRTKLIILDYIRV